ncbi:MAG: type II CAAX endopeptidase family protein [Gemmatimonadota bacterium]|nr:type II CAAX endopeptidase family protein [Gemmatimonadota bacterium]
MTLPPTPPGTSPLQLMSRVLAFLAAALTVLIATGLLRDFLPEAMGPLVWGTLSSAVLLTVLQWFLRRDQRSWQAIGLGWERGSAPRFGSGVLVGLATYAATLAVSSMLFGPIRFAPGVTPSFSGLVVVLAGILALAAMEELAFRSYPLWVSTEALGRWPAQVFIAVAFALLHIAYGWSVTTVVFGVLPSGLLFGMAAVASRGLALPFGIHAGLNLGRWLTGEADGAGPWRLNTTSLDVVMAGRWAHWVGASIPLLVGILIWWALARSHRPDQRATA